MPHSKNFFAMMESVEMASPLNSRKSSKKLARIDPYKEDQVSSICLTRESPLMDLLEAMALI